MADGAEDLRILVIAELGRQLFEQTLGGTADDLAAGEIVGVHARAAGIADFLDAAFDLELVTRHVATRIEEIDLEDLQIARGVVDVQHMLQRRVGDEASVPVMATVDLDRRKAGRQSAGGGDMAGIEPGLAIVEIGEIAGADVDRPQAEPGLAIIEEIEVNEPFQRLHQGLGVIGAYPQVRIGQQLMGRGQARRKEARNAEGGGGHGCSVVLDAPERVVLRRPAEVEA